MDAGAAVSYPSFGGGLAVRVAIIGSSGAGKSTLARSLGEALGAPVIELDALNWQAGWRDLVTHDPETFRDRIAAAVAGDRWVTDGNYSGVAFPLILPRATDLVWLDYGRSVIMRRVIGRSFTRAWSKKELWPGTGNREEFRRWLDKEHPIRWAWDTFERRRDGFSALFNRLQGGRVRLHRLRAPREADDLAERLAELAPVPPLRGEGG
jgi:adenylate kinase family enzyme